MFTFGNCISSYMIGSPHCSPALGRGGEGRGGEGRGGERSGVKGWGGEGRGGEGSEGVELVSHVLF